MNWLFVIVAMVCLYVGDHVLDLYTYYDVINMWMSVYCSNAVQCCPDEVVI